jgi:hypothetical protein
MAVVINDFEVIAEPPDAAGGTAPKEGESTPPPSSPEVERILQSLAERLARVEVH